MFSAMNDGFPAVGIACYDPLTAVVLVGSSPVGAFQTDPWSTLMAPLATITVPSQAIDCSVFNSTHLALTLMPTAPSQPLPIMLVQRWLLVDGIVTSSLINATTTITQSRMFTPSSTSNTTFTAVKRPNQTPLNASTSCVMFAEGATWTLQCSLLATGSFTLVLPATIVWMGFVGSVAVVTWTVPTSTLVWGMTIVSLPSQSNRTASILLTTNSQTVYLSDCEALNGCPVVGYCVSPQDAANSSNADATWSSSAIVCGASTALTTGNSLVFFALDYLTGLQIGASAVVPSASGISAAVLDVGFNNAIFSFVGATTAMLCRIQLSNPLALITLFSVDRINGDRPTVVQMSLNASTRTLWLSAATSEAVQAVAVNLFSISIVKPEVFDQRGGVTVTVTGVGFVPHPTPLCDFHSNDTLTSPSVSSTPAVFINATTLLCVAASVSMYDASCSTLSLNVWYGGRVTTTTLGSTTRPLSVTLDNATTADSGGMARTFHTADTVITLSGFGFVTSVTQATCRIEEADGTVVAVLPATPLSVTVAYCLQAVTITPTHLNAGVRYSHDGFVYSTSIAIFAVVGEWGGIQANALVSSNAASILTVKAQLASLIVAIEVQTTDSLGNVLGLLDSDSKQIICSSIDPVLLSDITAQQPLFTTSSSTILTTINGSVIFDNVQLSSPTTGTQTLYFFATLDRTISATFEIIVVPGNPASISLASGTSQASWASGVTTTFTIPAFYAVILDVVGNTVTDATNLPSSVTVQYTNTLPPVADTVGSAAQVVVVSYAATLDSKTSSYAFAGLSTMSPFNDFISLRFTTSDKTIQGLLYTMEQESCGTGSYGVQGGYVCFVCPADASCDGTTTIAAAPGYWRGTVTSPYLYACSPAQSCPSSTTCATGYEGAICGSCAAGYGRTVTSCDLCGSVVAPWIFVALIVVGFVVGVWFLALRSVAFSSPADVEARIVELPAKPSAVSILVKIALSHVQILSLLPLKRLAVGFVASALSSSGSWSVVTPGFLNVACAIGRRAVNEMYATVALAGLVGIGCCAVAWGMAYMDDRRFRAEAKRKAAAQRARVIKEAKASPVLFLAADEAHSAALFSSNKHCNEVLRNHKHLLEEYDGDLARNRVDPNDVQGWLNLEFDIDDNGSGTAGDFIPLVDLVASANGGSAPADGIAALGVRRPQIWKRAANLALLGFLVVTFLLYPTVVQAAVRVIQCRTVELGGGSAVSVVAYDPAIDCSTSDYIAGEVPAAAVLVAFGAGVPLLCPLAVMFARRYTCDQSLVRARQLFFFVTGGYRLWFWEGIVLARKAVIVVVVVLVGEDQVVCIICMWLLGAFLVLNLVLKPWEAERLGSLETLSLGALSLTCLCLAAFTSSGSVMSDGISIAMVVVVASLNGMVLLTLVGELSRQATNEVIELTGIEISPQWKIDSLRQQLAKITRQLRRRHFSRVADVSELLSEASEVTLAMLARRRQAIVTGASRMEMDRQRNEMIEKEKMMHLDWDPSTMSSSEPLDGVHDMYDDDYGSGKVNSKMRDDDFSMFLRPQTMVSHEDGSPRGVSRQRSVFFDMPEKPGSDDHNNEDTFSLHRRRASLFSPSSVRTTSRESFRLSNFSFRMEVLSDDAEDDSDSDEREVHPDIVNPFRQTCFEDNPWDVLVRSGQQREFLRSREQVITRDLGEVEALDMDATISTLTSSSEGSLDRQRFELRSRERASAFVRPSSSQSRWVQPIDDPIVFTAVDLPGFADDIEFDGDISVDDVELGHLGDTRVVVAPWGDELISPAMFDDDDELLVNATTTTGLPRRSRQSRKDADSNYKPQLVRFRSATTAKQSVEAAMHTLESQYLGAARAFWAVLADVRTASEMMSMQKVLSLNARLGVLLEELYVAEYTFLHMVWVYEHHVRTGLWDEVHEEPGGGELITDGGEERSGKESGLEVGALSSEDRYMTGSLDLNECDFESMDTATNDAQRLR
ncbi:transmembrane protein, putative [Bodo saltans]|uniref:Transmembrane protein, putative n=1 Tax=Bodo saltans TaxID=75058 RepID=A0A0S4JHN7_BODSA|nr:transmembrane protein, putative [Bodo saltans]|eukprot:CUG89502.1 transmembrane protein, putative [Bodo saltans]